MRPDDRAILEELRSATAGVLEDVIGRGATVALLDVPNQRNVGDSMIWAGQVEYLRQLGTRTVYVADIGSYDPQVLRRVLPKEGVILIRGGGDFGDIWRGHQRHREAIARDFPDRRIVQLPQSVWFNSAEAAAQCNSVLGAHPDFLLLLRDRDSRERAALQLPDIPQRFCWDLALGWEPRPVARPRIGHRVLVIARTDREGSSGLASVDVAAALGRDTLVVDWTDPSLDTRGWRWARKVPLAATKRPRLRRARWFLPIQRASFTWINRANLRGGTRLYAHRSIVIVDRLHAHILAVLLGIDHVVLDNSYGKIGAVSRDYSGAFSTAHFAASAESAIEQARAIIDSGG